ncbi:MAG: phosphopantothenoylcysteine decarboxylase [Treponema sp.]|nr:phosphopantothenoylcysteine decarboxylase [Treponema sp.]
MKILITGGGCREAIDNVRCVTNTSTGKTSAIIADYFSRQGCLVTVLTAASAIKPQEKCIIRSFVSGADLGQLLEEELTTHEYQLVIHAAAVSDFIPETVIMDGLSVAAGPEGKIPSGSSMTVTFRAAPKLADKIKGWAKEGGHKEPTVVCFKLTSGADAEKVLATCHAILSRGAADFVIANDILNITAKSHPFVVNILKNNQVEAFQRGKTEEEMAKILYQIATENT